MPVNNGSTPSIATRRGEAARPGPLGRAANWMVGATAAVLVLISLGGYMYNRGRLSAVAAEHLRLIVTGPPRLYAGVAAEYLVSTTSIGGQPLPAQIEFALFGADGKLLKAYREHADAHGQLKVAVPADLRLPRQLKLHVAARHRNSREEMEMPLLFEREPYQTRVVLDGRQYRPADTVRFRSLTLSQYNLAACRDKEIEFEFFGPDGSALPGSKSVMRAQQGVAAGEFRLPADLPLGRYRLIARSIDGTFPESNRDFTVIGPSPEPSKNNEPAADSPSNEVEVVFFPEGGILAAGLENRVFFTARDRAGRPVQIAGTVGIKGDKTDVEPVATFESNSAGLGEFSFLPNFAATYILNITKPQDMKAQAELPAASDRRPIVLSTGRAVFDVGQPLEFNLRTAHPGLPLVVAAKCRGIQVGQQPLVAKSSDAGGNPVAVALDRAAGGAIDLSVYDYSDSPPKQLAWRTVYRHPARWLNVGLEGIAQQYVPGRTVEVAVSVTDETGKPTAAVLGVSAVAKAGAAKSLAAQFLLNAPSDGDFPIGVQKLLFGPVDDKAAATLGVMLGARQIDLQLSADPPAVFDNIDRIRNLYEQSLADYEANRVGVLSTLTTLSFFGGLGLVVLVAMLGLMGIVSGIHLWAAAIGATTCCLIVGAILVDPGRPPATHGTAVPFTSYYSSAGQSDKPAVDQPLPAKSALDQVAFPESQGKAFYWNPLLVTDDQGKASFEVQLPKTAGQMLITVDAHSDGRLGSGLAELEITVPKADAPPPDSP